MKKEDMRGLFFIVKGQYKTDNSKDGVCVSGYDPEDPNTKEWYMLVDNVTFRCFACGSDLNKVIGGVSRVIFKFKTRERYFKHVCKVTSEDYYEVHYRGRRPLTHDEIVKKAEGKCPRVSPAMKALYSKIYSCYGDYYSDLVKVEEDKAYKELKEQTPFHKSKKLMSKIKLEEPVVEKPKKVLENEQTQVETQFKLKKIKPKLGLRKLSV